MKKYGLFIVCLILSGLLLSACTTQKKASMVNAHRRLEKYLPSEQSQSKPGVIDLTEGPQLKYNAKFGPKDLNFDIKIVNPYD